MSDISCTQQVLAGCYSWNWRMASDPLQLEVGGQGGINQQPASGQHDLIIERLGDLAEADDSGT